MQAAPLTSADGLLQLIRPCYYFSQFLPRIEEKMTQRRVALFTQPA